jgi:rSAM/selenodomain-associated transferase 1
MVLDTVDLLKRAPVPFVICFDPPGSLDRVQRWLGQEYSYIPQTGDDLGERMEQAFVRVFREGMNRVLLIGSDIPGLDPAVIIDAFAALASHDAVIGPANDGGYYLIGFQKNRFEPGIFHDMIWSTETVFSETINRLREESRRVRVLPQCQDADTKENLKALLARYERLESPASRTASLLMRNRMSILE